LKLSTSPKDRAFQLYQVVPDYGLIGEFYPFSLKAVHRPNVHQKNYKKNQVRTLSLNPLVLHFSFSNLVLLNLCAFVSLVVGRLVFPLFTTFLLSFIHPTFLPSSYLFCFDKFSSFLPGTFGAPHLVIKNTKKGRKETTKERVKARCRITKKTAKEGK
jgi:hypothetical protein